MDSYSPRIMTSRLLHEETDARTEATTTTLSSCYAGELVDNHHSHGAATDSTMPPCTPCLVVGSKTSMTMPGRANKTGWIIEQTY
jgi:hypothetical protein